MDEFKFKPGDLVQTNEFFKTEYKYELPFRGKVTNVQYVKSLGKEIPYVDVDHRKSIPQKYLELAKYKSPYDDPEFQKGIEKLTDQKNIAVSKCEMVKAELKKVEADIKSVDRNIKLFEESYGIYKD